MMTPNYENLLAIILILAIFNAAISITLGCLRIEKKMEYGNQDIISGLITLTILGYYVLLG